MDVDNGPEQDQPGSPASPWPTDAEAEVLDQTSVFYGEYSAGSNSHRQVTIGSPVVERPATPTPDQAAASPLDDDMQDEENFEDHWSMRNRAPF